MRVEKSAGISAPPTDKEDDDTDSVDDGIPEELTERAANMIISPVKLQSKENGKVKSKITNSRPPRRQL